MVARLTNLPGVEMTVCTAAFSGGSHDAVAFGRVMKHLGNLEVRCMPLAPTASSITIETPPMRRLD